MSQKQRGTSPSIVRGNLGGMKLIKKENLIFIEEAMRHTEVIEVVERAASQIWHKIPDVTSFEHTCYVEIGKGILRNEVKSIEGLANYITNRSAARHVNKTKYEPPITFSEMESEDREDVEEIEFEPEDVLANVEGEVIAKEMTALLAQGDHLLEEIVGYWAIGNTNNASISRSLARTFGGNAESHRRRINRFRHDCRKHLSAAV